MSSRSWFRVELDRDTCSLCEVCAKRCPAGALTVSRSGRTLEILFDPASCHGCGGEIICQEICPEKSIAVVRAGDGPTPLGPVLLARGEMVECPRCKALFAPQSKLLVVQQKQLLEEKRVQDHCPDCRRTLLLGNYPRPDSAPMSEG